MASKKLSVGFIYEDVWKFELLQFHHFAPKK